jgi:fructose-1,6-bisphosphatase-3
VVVVGDIYDRGPRADLCVDHLMSLPSVTITWGNHDIAWMGAWLGQKALIAFVLRVSCRYNRLSQLDEGYGISMLPLRQFSQSVYGDDPCPRHKPKREDVRPLEVVRKMHKAIAIIQYKLDAHTVRRNPHWGVSDRNLMPGLDLDKGTLTVDGEAYPLRDTNWPTYNKADPLALSPEEEALMDKYVELFTGSQRMGRHMRFLLSHGCMWAVRDSHLCFHACVPVDAQGEYQTFACRPGGKQVGGKALLDAIDVEIRSPRLSDIISVTL